MEEHTGNDSPYGGEAAGVRSPAASDPEEDQSTLRVFLPIIRSIWFIGVFTLSVGVFTAIWSLLTTKQYGATVTVLPASKGNMPDLNSQAMAAFAPNLAAALGGELGLEAYVKILQSRRVFTNVIMRTYTPSDPEEEPGTLLQHYEIGEPDSMKALELARLKLSSNTEINHHKLSGLITITVRDRDRAVAAAVTDAFLEELVDYTRNVYTSSARMAAEFLEGRVETIHDSLLEVEGKWLTFREENQAIHMSPALLLRQERLQTEIRFLREMYLEMNLNLERARAGEVEKAPVVNVLDAPETPGHRAWPLRTRMVLISLVLGGFVAVVWVYISSMLRREVNSADGSKVAEEVAEEIEQLKERVSRLIRVVLRRKRD